jgi:hypothetical protein
MFQRGKVLGQLGTCSGGVHEYLRLGHAETHRRLVREGGSFLIEPERGAVVPRLRFQSAALQQVQLAPLLAQLLELRREVRRWNGRLAASGLTAVFQQHQRRGVVTSRDLVLAKQRVGPRHARVGLPTALIDGRRPQTVAYARVVVQQHRARCRAVREEYDVRRLVLHRQRIAPVRLSETAGRVVAVPLVAQCRSVLCAAGYGRDGGDGFIRDVVDRVEAAVQAERGTADGARGAQRAAVLQAAVRGAAYRRDDGLLRFFLHETVPGMLAGRAEAPPLEGFVSFDATEDLDARGGQEVLTCRSGCRRSRGGPRVRSATAE